MHQSSMEKMEKFRDKYLGSRIAEPLVILDIGSQDVNGSYRDLFDSPKWTYIGVDMAHGKNVDIALSNPYRLDKIRSSSIDVVVSGQALEHIEFFWITMLEVARVLKQGALCCILVPSGGPEHRFPVDCWRFYPDGLRALARYARLDVLEVATQWEVTGYHDGSNDWKDSILVSRKPHVSVFQAVRDNLRMRIQNWVLTRSFER